MTRSSVHRLMLLGALGLGMTAPSARAQSLEAYSALATSLDSAVQARSSSAGAALTQLDAAQAAFTRLEPTLRNRQLTTGLSGALEGARGALARTPAELEAQVLLARGLMRRALYDQTLAGLSGGTPEGTPAQLGLLAREFGLSTEATAALKADSAAGQLPRVAWRLQRAAVQKVSAALAASRPEQTPASYLNLARATGWFTVVQDAASGGGLKVSQFGDALRQLTGGDMAALNTSLTTLRQGAQTLAGALASAPAPTSAPTPPSSGTGAAGPSAAPPTIPAAPAPVGPAVTPPQGQDQTTPPAQSPEPSPAAASPVGTGPTGTGPDRTAAVYSALGRALSAAGHGDPVGARGQLTQAQAALTGVPAALRTAQGYDGLVADVAAAQTRSPLRPGDVQALIGGLSNLERRAAGEEISALDRASLAVSRTFSGWLRVLVFALLAGLCVIPLYLLNLAFGGRNPYWRAIAVGLALLLLPVFLEGLFGLLGALGDVAGVGALRGASNVTLTQGPYALPVWALLSALAIGLSAYGFRGLCQQFGLLGRRADPAIPASPSLDWDEDL